MTTVKENLIAARALIDTPEKWVKDAYDRHGCYCAIGAIENLGGDWDHYKTKPQLTDAIAYALPGDFEAEDASEWDTSRGRARVVMQFNDHPDTTHADILALFDRSIAAAEQVAP